MPSASRFEIPTQSCVLTHVTSTIALIEQGAPVDLVFQSVAGTQAANASFGVTLALLQEGLEAGRSLKRGTVGDNVMYFETGQGSALSAGAHHGVDQQTIEARAYAVARAYAPLLVNTVVGFIGPEYLYDGKQIIRAGLEDHFCGKLLGLPMGCDICYTNHAEADQDDMDTLLTLLGAAGVTFIMGVPGADDIMLNYQSTSFHDQLYIREVLGLKRAPEFEAWLQRMEITDAGGRLSGGPGGQALLAADAGPGGMSDDGTLTLARTLGEARCADAGPDRARPLGSVAADAGGAALRACPCAGARRGARGAAARRPCGGPRGAGAGDGRGRERRPQPGRISAPARSRAPARRREPCFLVWPRGRRRPGDRRRRRALRHRSAPQCRAVPGGAAAAAPARRA